MASKAHLNLPQNIYASAEVVKLPDDIVLAAANEIASALNFVDSPVCAAETFAILFSLSFWLRHQSKCHSIGKSNRFSLHLFKSRVYFGLFLDAFKIFFI